MIFSSTLIYAACTTFSPVSDTSFVVQNITNDHRGWLPLGVNTTFKPYMTNTTNIIISEGATCPANSTKTCYIGDPHADVRPWGTNYTFVPKLIGGLVADNSTLRFSATHNGRGPLNSFPPDITNDVSSNLFSLITKASNMTFKLALLDNQTSAEGVRHSSWQKWLC